MDNRLSKARRIVVKIGSATLVDPETGKPRAAWLAALAEDLANLHAAGADVIVVSSGAIALGRRSLGLPQTKLKLEQKQAAAAVGQITLAQAWQSALERQNIVAAQVLVTLNDTEERRRYLNATATLNTLLKQKAIPVINENDTVATTEIRYGDNDRLAARVASMMSADCLVLLSDIDGFYSGPPGQTGSEFMPEIRQITRSIEAMAGKPVSGVGSGGMITKIEAAKVALAAGCHMVIASGHERHPLKRILEGKRCSWFLAAATPKQARKRWIAGSLKPAGSLVVDRGAAEALAKGKSLLAAGVRDVHGRFSRGDAVSVIDEQGHEFARGLVNYDATDAAKVKGCKTVEIEKRLGLAGAGEFIHRDNLVILTDAPT
jgi:glutamate 5-kinase